MVRSDGALLRWRVPFAIAVLALVVAGVTAMPAEGRAPAAVAQAQCSASAWSSGSSYNQGDVVSHNGHQWRANSWLWPGVEPGVSGSPPWWVPWADIGACGGGTTTTSTTSTTQPPSTTSTTVPQGGGSVEAFFAAPGPWAVSTGTASAPGTPGVTLYYPTNLGADGFDHPIITFGNGTSLTCEHEAPHQRHLASWGYAVVCANSGWTGSGVEILAAAEWLIDQDANPSSVFFDQLDTSKVGATGGSQGASGAVNAMIQSGGAISSTLAVALTDPWIHIWGPPPDMTQVDDPLLFMSGTTDGLTSQAQQQTYYNQVPGPAAKAAAVGVGHDWPASFYGYMTAWFRYTLEGDQFARRAFVTTGGNPPEISIDSEWTNWAAKSLP
jgi:hypothetical protein